MSLSLKTSLPWRKLPAKGATIFAIPMKIKGGKRRSTQDFRTPSLEFKATGCNEALVAAIIGFPLCALGAYFALRLEKL